MEPPQQPSSQRKYPVPVLVIVGVVLAVVLMGLCGLGWVNMLVNPTPTTPALIIQGGDSPTDTASPADTAIFAPTVGGTTDDFQQRFGAAIDSSGLMFAGTIADKRVLILLTLDQPSQSLDNESHVIIVAVQVPGDALGVETWTAATADTIAQTFLPPDAQFQRTATTNGVSDHIYQSNGMAQTFTADQFTNDFGNKQVAVGTVSYSCHAWPPSAGGYGQCIIAIDS